MTDMNERRRALNDYLTKLVHESKKCATCAFNDLCFFAYECFPNYKHYVRKDTLPPEEGGATNGND